ncbi:MAG: hypothetical protein IJ629_04040 [Clostridia bacterium]|nr:hypothetical protein [Clostridia bacterium]
MEDFQGTRQFTVLADMSNLKNYIEGGRSSLELVIRMKSVDWLNVEISSDEYDIRLDFSFEFSSFEDYISKIEYLLTYNPSIINEEGNYIEGFATRDLVNYLKDELQAKGLYLSDTEEIELFKSEDSKIIFLDELEYEAQNERIKHQENEDIALSLKNLKIDTSYDEEEAIYTRTMEFEIETESDSLLNSMKKSFMARCKKEKVEYKNDEIKKFSVEFSRNSEKELSSTTMVLLNTGASIGIKEQYNNGNNLKVTFAEYLDLQDILVDEAEFSYTFDVSGFEKAQLIDGYNENTGFSLEENVIKVTEPKSSYQFAYQKKFEFDKVEIITDFTNDWHITRTISMRTRTILAKNIHNEIKESLVNSIPNGTTLNIYDKGAYRYYDIVFEGDSDKINSITSKITDGEANLKVNQMLLPFMPSKVEDSITIDQICSYVENYNNIEQKYIFSKDTKLPNEEELVVERAEDGSIIVVQNKNISITYKKFDKILFAKVLILIIIVIVVLLIIKHKMKKLVKKLKEKKEAKKLAKAEKTKQKADKKNKK